MIPTVSGTTQRGSALTAASGTWSGIDNTYGYQWQRDGTDIPNATAATYTLGADDVGKAVRVVVTATNPEGSASRASAATATIRTAPPVNTVMPTITGAAMRTSTLSASQGTWSGAGNTYTYQWQQDAGTGFTDIAGATGTTYVLGVAEVGKRIRVRVTAANADATVTATSFATGVVQAGPPANWSAPTVSGTARRTATLTATPGTWTGIGNEYAYQWQRRVATTWTDIAGATRHDLHARLRRRRRADPRARHRDEPRRDRERGERGDRGCRIGTAAQHRRCRASAARRSWAAR